MSRSFETEADVWNQLGNKDPFWAILRDQNKGHLWVKDEFFQSGEYEIAAFMTQLDRLDRPVRLGRCLDFGCGVGRLTRPLAKRFDEAHGIDVADSMVKQARKLHGDLSNIHFHCNKRDDLGLFPDNHFDVIYSRIVLQHIPPANAQQYVAEFVRILKPGGVAVFQIPARALSPSEYPRFDISVELLEGPKSLSTGEKGTYRIRLRNEMTRVLKGVDEHPLSVGNHWYDSNGNMMIRDDGRLIIEEGLQPGEARDLSVTATAPDPPGDYLIGFDGVLEGWFWFGDDRNRVVLHPVAIEGKAKRRMAAAAPLARLAKKVAARVRSKLFNRASSAEDTADFSMYGIPRDHVVNRIEESGGKIIKVEVDYSAGVHWESYFYWATK